jgi:putative membrane protein
MNRIKKIEFNWRLMLVQILSNALSLGLTTLILPGIRFQAERMVLALLVSGLIFGLLNAFVRPVLQFIMFRFLFITFGLVLIVINFFLLRLLGRLTPGWFESDGILWTLLAAVFVGLFGVFFETLLGMRPPIQDDKTKGRLMENLLNLSGPAAQPVSVPTLTTVPEAPIQDLTGKSDQDEQL